MLLTVSPLTSGSLYLVTTRATSAFEYFRYRIGHRLGGSVLIEYSIGRLGTTQRYAVPTVSWRKDGLPTTHSPISRSLDNNELVSNLQFRAAMHHEGLYQCIFTDTVRSQWFLPHPIRLDISEPLAARAATGVESPLSYKHLLYTS